MNELVSVKNVLQLYSLFINQPEISVRASQFKANKFSFLILDSVKYINNKNMIFLNKMFILLILQSIHFCVI